MSIQLAQVLADWYILGSSHLHQWYAVWSSGRCVCGHPTLPDLFHFFSFFFFTDFTYASCQNSFDYSLWCPWREHKCWDGSWEQIESRNKITAPGGERSMFIKLSRSGANGPLKIKMSKNYSKVFQKYLRLAWLNNWRLQDEQESYKMLFQKFYKFRNL